MDKGLQERLVGAAVLVALGVWLIPWVLDGSASSEQSPEEAVALKLPAPEAPGSAVVRQQTIEFDADRGTPLKSPAGVPESAAETEAAPQSAQSVTPAVTAAVAAPEDTQAASEAEPKVAAAAAATAETDVTAPEPPASLPDILAASRVVGWMVQLGSFSDAGNARRQAQRVETFGHDARIYEFDAAGGRTMFRVRLGPIDTRERAEAAASSLAAHGFVAQLVAPE